MSIVGGVSGSSQNLYQYLQSLNSSPVAPATRTQPVGSVGGNCSESTPSTSSESSSQSSSGTTSGAASLVQQLETAIQNALNGVNQSGQSNNPQAVLSSVEQAVQTTLQQNGIDPSQAAQAGGQPHHHGHHHGGGGGGSGGGLLAALTSNTSSSSTGSDSSSSGSSSSSSQTPGLNSLLTQLNIDPQQFRNDIISALSSSQNGTIDQSQVFQSFPTGQNVNVLT